jgi:hypothetical protein
MAFMGLINLIFNLKMQQIRLHPKSSKMRYKMSMGSRTMNYFLINIKLGTKCLWVSVRTMNSFVLVRVDKAC